MYSIYPLPNDIRGNCIKWCEICKDNCDVSCKLISDSAANDFSLARGNGLNGATRMAFTNKETRRIERRPRSTIEVVMNFFKRTKPSGNNPRNGRRIGYTLCLVAMGTILGACSSIVDKHVEWETVEPEQYPMLSAVGYAPIATQRGQTETEKMLMAVKASKLEAYRELAEQVYGQRLSGEQSISNLVIDNEVLKASVDGVIRGAEVVKSYPVGEDTYATELSLDMQRVYDIYLTMAKPKRIRAVKYY